MEAIMTRDFACAREKPAKPEDLARLFLDRANAGDVDGGVALYEAGAVLAFRRGRLPSAPRRSGRCMKHFWLTVPH